MNWNDIKNGLNSKPARIIYAVIVIAAIMTAVGFGIYYLYKTLNPDPCQPGQYYHEGDGVCYPGECANDCDDDNAKRNWNKENKTCDCECIDGYNNNNSDKKCRPECAKGTSCDSGQTCAYVQSHNNPEIQCLTDDQIENYGKACNEDYNDSNLKLYCTGDFECKKGYCVNKKAVKCDKDFVQACDSNVRGSCGGSECKKDESNNSPFFNQFRNDQGSKSRLGTCDTGTQCCDLQKITLAIDENLNSMYGSCCRDDTPYPAIATDENRSGCCPSEPCKSDGKCVLEGYTCTTDGICPNSKVYDDEGKSKCCTDGIVYQNVNDGKTVTHCSTKDHKIYIKTDGGKCNADSDCSSNKHQQCIGIRQSDNSFDGPFCRAYCDAGYDVEGNTCNLSNICGWDIETGNAEFTPEQPPALSTGKFNVCSKDSTKYWKAPIDSTNLDEYKLNIVSTATEDKCNKVPKDKATPDMIASCAALFDSYYETSDIPSQLVYNNDKNKWECSATLDCCNIKPNIKPNIKKPKSNSVRLENFGDSPSPPSPNACNSREGIGPNESWITQDVGAENISAVWNGTNYNTQGNQAQFIPFNNELRPKPNIKYSYLNNGEFCDKLSLDGTTCEDYADKSICPMTNKNFTVNQYTNNVRCNFPRNWSCGNIDSPIYGWNPTSDDCCKNGILNPINSTNKDQPKCKKFTFDRDVSIGSDYLKKLVFNSDNYYYHYSGSSNLDIKLLNKPTEGVSIKLKNSLCIFREGHDGTNLYLNLKDKKGTYSFQLTDKPPDLNIFYNINTPAPDAELGNIYVGDFSYPGGLKTHINITTGHKNPLFMNFDTKYSEKHPHYLKNELITLSGDAGDSKYNSVFPACFTNSSTHNRIIIVAAHIEHDSNNWWTTGNTINVLCKKKDKNSTTLAFRTFDLTYGSLQTQLKNLPKDADSDFRPLELTGVTLPYILAIKNDDSADQIIYNAVNPGKKIENYITPQQISDELKKKPKL